MDERPKCTVMGSNKTSGNDLSIVYIDVKL